MKKIVCLAFLYSLGLHIDLVMAAGLVPIPSPGGTSAYVLCRSNGNFGATADTSLPPATDDQCVVNSGVGTSLGLNSSPESGFTLQSANSSPISAFSETLATLNERVFRNSGSSECIYAKGVLLTSNTTHDYYPAAPGTQRMEVNDLAFGGYIGNVSAGYAKPASFAGSVYRIGRTFTSVQMQPDYSNPYLIGPGFNALPPIGGTAGTEIYGLSQQMAPVSASWVDFSVDLTGGTDLDGYTNLVSPNLYIKVSCATATTSVVANSFKLRQTGQWGQPWVVVTAASRAPRIDIAP